MFNFFCNNKISSTEYAVTGGDHNHIANVLRMKKGEQLIISDNGISHLCSIENFNPDSVIVKIVQENYADTSLPISISLFQGLPKSDKMEMIIQKAVELGADEIVPVEMARSVVKLLGNKKDNKTQRWQAIAESAGKQSKRANITNVLPVISIKNAVEKIKDFDLFIVPYESKNGMQDTKDLLSIIKAGMKIGVLVGPEGGFEQKEIDACIQQGAKIISLGKRILRTETASLTALSMLMLHAEMNI
jgi:16S rRNA (uracil1498-N3)-methyltransferase